MAVSQGFLDMIRELLAPVGSVSARRMFGAAGIYCDGIMFALADDDVLFFKADQVSKARYEAEGCGPFTYQGQTGLVSLQYWRLPERLYDEPDEFVEFAREAITVAAKAKSAKAGRPAKPAPTNPSAPRPQKQKRSGKS